MSTARQWRRPSFAGHPPPTRLVAYRELSSYWLNDLLRFLRIPHPANRHRALPDVEVTVQLFEHLIAVGSAVGRWTSIRLWGSKTGHRFLTCGFDGRGTEAGAPTHQPARDAPG